MNPDELEKLINRLLRLHGAALRLYASTWTNSPDDPVQQALIKLSIAQPFPDNPVAWLYKVVRNEAISRNKSEQRRRRREQLSAAGNPLFQVSNEAGFDTDELARAMAELPTGIREVIVTRIWGGLKFDEIAQAVGCSTSAAHRRYQTGLEQLRSKMIVNVELEKKSCHE